MSNDPERPIPLTPEQVLEVIEKAAAENTIPPTPEVNQEWEQYYKEGMLVAEPMNKKSLNPEKIENYRTK